MTLRSFSDRPTFHEEDSTWSRGVQRVGGRAGLSEQGGGGVRPSLACGSAQRAG